MPLISNTDFMVQQGYLGSGYLGLYQAQNCIESGLVVVVASTDVDVEVDMLGAYSQNMVTVDSQATSGLLRQAYDALVEHVTNHTGQTFNDYLYSRSLKVSQAFATLSGNLGLEIAPENIQ